MSDLIETLVEKVSSYNIFNYLFPGAVFLAGLEIACSYPLPNWNTVLFLVIAYFVGMTLSRIGSLIVGPFLKWVGFVKFCDYKDFLSAERNDKTLTTLSQENNTFRTLITVFAGLVVAKIIKVIVQYFPDIRCWLHWLWPIALLFLFLFSYRKMTTFIVRRVAAANK